MNIPISQRIREYRERATEIRQIARNVSDEAATKSLREMADRYNRMADHLEGKDDSSPL
jgi:hypothetical protein